MSESEHDETTPAAAEPGQPDELGETLPSDDPAEERPDKQPDEAPAEEPAAEMGAAEPEPEPEEEAEAGEAEAEERPEKPAKTLPPEALAMCKAAIEAILFASAEPLRSRKLAEALRDTGIDARGVRKLVGELAKDYDAARRGIAIEEVAGGFQILTRPEYVDYVAAAFGGSGGGKLSQAALETLAVVAYKQPVTRADVEAIRGVQAGPLLRTLLHKGLIRITGRAEVLGRPLLYGTTDKFLEHFGLKSLNELPKVEELPKP